MNEIITCPFCGNGWFRHNLVSVQCPTCGGSMAMSNATAPVQNYIEDKYLFTGVSGSPVQEIGYWSGNAWKKSYVLELSDGLSPLPDPPKPGYIR